MFFKFNPYPVCCSRTTHWIGHKKSILSYVAEATIAITTEIITVKRVTPDAPLGVFIMVIGILA